MGRQRFRGLYLQATGHPLSFSFVTYTPQTREQMVACGDLRADEEYFNPVNPSEVAQKLRDLK